MYGAILGDMIGAPFEFDRGDKTKDFEMFSDETQFTDDTVMTVAVANGLMNCRKGAADEEIMGQLVSSMRFFGRKYPAAGYGFRFAQWLLASDPRPYGSCGYDLSRTIDEIRPDYYHQELCQVTVPEAITAFLEGNDFEDVIRTAVSLGGDSDTLTCIAGSMAEAYYGVPEPMICECRERLTPELLQVVDDFRAVIDRQNN